MKLKILVVDDEESIRNAFKSLLEDLGCEVSIASEPSHCNVYQGHDCNKSNPCFDAVITDYNMPGMTGLEYLERLQKNGCKGAISNAVLMSGNTACIDMDRVKKLGCMVMQKPIDLTNLQRWLEGIRIRIRIRIRLV